MDELIKAVSQKTGLPPDQAKAAAQAVLDFLKTKLPAPISSQIDGLLSGGGDITKKIGGLFG
jgi:ABC-type amino acid transport substrate-binding protein